MDIIIRADANHNIGMGHIMRCLSIADAFYSLSHYVSFLLADGGVSEYIRQRGYAATVLNTDYTAMDEELELWPSITPDLLIVDSYYVTNSYLSSLREKLNNTGGKLVYIDDVLSFPYTVDCLIDYNAYANAANYHKLFEGLKEPRLILGPTYAPLRSMFRGIPRHTQPEIVTNVLISTGGSDEFHLALNILRHLLVNQVVDNRGVYNTVTYHFLIGAMNTDKEVICELAKCDDRIVLHENVSDMKSLICSSDLVISAAGSTMYEICACGVPLLTYSLADNQIPGAEAFEKIGLGVNIGDLRDPGTIDPDKVMSGKLRSNAPELILTETEKLVGNFEKRMLMGRRMQELIDGFGADRLIEEVLKTLRI